MSKQYRMMIYFVVSTVYFYREDIKYGISVASFRELNPDVIKRVFAEGKSLFDYKLSSEQMDKGISAYLTSTLHYQSVKNTEIATL